MWVIDKGGLTDEHIYTVFDIISRATACRKGDMFLVQMACSPIKSFSLLKKADR